MRTPKIEADWLLAAARQVFLEDGLQATTAKIAERAQVSEGTLFKRYGSKVGLFKAMLQSVLEEPAWLAPLERESSEGPIEKSLVDLAERGIEHFQKLVPLMMMAWSSADRGYLPRSFSQPSPPQVSELRALSRYLAAEMRAGRLSSHDPEVTARLFLGALQNYAILALMEQACTELQLPARSYAQQVVKLLLDGLRPARAARSPKPGLSAKGKKARVR